MNKHLADQLFLVVCLVVSVLLYVSTDTYPGIAQKTSAVYVRFLAISFGLLACVQIFFNWFGRNSLDKIRLADHVPKFVGLLVALILFAIAFEPFGFFISALIFMPVVAFLLGSRNYPWIAITSIGAVSFVYVVFVQLIGVNLPGSGF
jgi:putative tricarboxylic transport membrane protein